MRRGTWLLLGVCAAAASGCEPDVPAPVPATPVGATDGATTDVDARRLLARTRELERELRDLHQELERLTVAAVVQEATLRVTRARLADRERELAALRSAPPEPAGAPTVAEPTDSAGETAPDYVRRMLDTIASDPSTALDEQIDWPGFVATMLAEGGGGEGASAPLDPTAAMSALNGLPAEEREAAFAGARDLLNELLGGPEGLTALKPRVGQHYRLGRTTRVELLADGPGGAPQRFTLSVSQSGGRWRIVGLARD